MEQNESIVIILPTPPAVLSPNCAMGTMRGTFAKAAAVRKQRRLACEAVCEGRIESLPWAKVSVSPTFYVKTNRRRDTDNAISSLKSAYDGIIDAGVVADDTPEYMKRNEPSFVVDRNCPRLELLIERIA